MPRMPGKVAVVLKGYPRLSETFIAQEIHALEERGLDLVLYSLRQPTDTAVHPVHDAIAAPVYYLPEYLYQEPGRVLHSFAAVRTLPGFKAAWSVWHRDLIRDPTPNRIRRFGQALVLAAELAPEVDRLHAHFLHTPGSVARYAATIRGLPWSVSAHAKDIWTLPAWEKSEKLAACQWAVTCTEHNRRHLEELAPEGRVELVYHGLDFSRFAAKSDPSGSARNGGSAEDPVILLSVGRAVEKKGYGGLIKALAALPPDLHWRLVHIGGGPLRERLKAAAREAGLAARVDWRGAQAQDAVIAAYRAADLFVLPSLIAGDGDRDGLPNVLMEAQSQGLACLSTRVSAIPELIEDGRTGVLVGPGDDAALSSALAGLIADPDRRNRLGQAAEEHVRGNFSMAAGIDHLAGLFVTPPASVET